MLYNYFTNKKVKLNLENTIIIGNSGNILYNKKGDIINNFDTIIRINDAPVKKYEQYVGNLTNIRFCAHNAIYNININLLKNTNYLIIWGTDNHLIKLKNIIINIKKSLPDIKILKLRNDFLNYNYSLYYKFTGKVRTTYTWLSSGWFCIFFSLLYTNNLTIYGFGFLNKKNCNYHYYNRLNGNQNNYFKLNQNIQGHKFIFESKIFLNLIKNNKLKFLS